jgi:hypothetical protein
MKLSSSRVFRCGFAALLVFACAGGEARAATIVVAKTESIFHNQTNSPFFTVSSNGTTTLAPTATGWAPIAPTQAAAATTTSTTPKKTFTFVGDSTSAGNWVDGNGIPAGITLTFDAQFTITATPAGSLLTVPAATGGPLGQGIGVTSVVGGNDDIDAPEGIAVSPVLVSGVSFTGSMLEPGFTFTPGGVSGFGTTAFRSSTFNNMTAGMVLTQGSDTIGFGVATGSLASNQQINNNLGEGTPASSVFPRQTGPYTLASTVGVSVIKGIALGYDVSYDVTAVPEPGALILVVCGVAGCGLFRRRVNRLA